MKLGGQGLGGRGGYVHVVVADVLVSEECTSKLVYWH